MLMYECVCVCACTHVCVQRSMNTDIPKREIACVKLWRRKWCGRFWKEYLLQLGSRRSPDEGVRDNEEEGQVPEVERLCDLPCRGQVFPVGNQMIV